MPAPQNLSWIKSATNELNNLLQVIAESSQFLEQSEGQNENRKKYFDIIRNGVERATAVTRQMVERANEVTESASPRPDTMSYGKPASSGSSFAVGGPIQIANPEGPRELVLIVDDEDFVTLLAQRVLTDEGYRVITARDGLQALEIYKKLSNEISLVILDFTMPIMDGSEVFEELRMINPQVAVVLSSGFTEQDKLRWMLAKGLQGFIPKPYTQQKLLLQVRSVLDAVKG